MTTNELAQPAALGPAEELGTLVGWATVLFYAAEHEHNPGVTTLWDAYHYITTALSVGYANIFPVTPLGKMIGGVVMTVGPAMSGRALDTTRPCGAEDVAAASDPALAAKLDEVIAELRKVNAALADRSGR